MPDKLNAETTDGYGRPYGWCEICWSKFARDRNMDQLSKAIKHIKTLYGCLGEKLESPVVSELKNRAYKDAPLV